MFRDIFPIFRDAVVVPERFIDGGECGESDEAEGEEDECADTDKENRGRSLATEPASDAVGRARRIVGRTEVWKGECYDEESEEHHVGTLGDLEKVMEIFRFHESVGEEEPGGECREKQLAEKGTPGGRTVVVEKGSDKEDSQEGESCVKREIVPGEAEKGE